MCVSPSDGSGVCTEVTCHSITGVKKRGGKKEVRFYCETDTDTHIFHASFPVGINGWHHHGTTITEQTPDHQASDTFENTLEKRVVSQPQRISSSRGKKKKNLVPQKYSPHDFPRHRSGLQKWENKQKSSQILLLFLPRLLVGNNGGWWAGTRQEPQVGAVESTRPSPHAVTLARTASTMHILLEPRSRNLSRFKCIMNMEMGKESLRSYAWESKDHLRNQYASYVLLVSEGKTTRSRRYLEAVNLGLHLKLLIMMSYGRLHCWTVNMLTYRVSNFYDISKKDCSNYSFLNLMVG